MLLISSVRLVIVFIGHAFIFVLNSYHESVCNVMNEDTSKVGVKVVWPREIEVPLKGQIYI